MATAKKPKKANIEAKTEPAKKSAPVYFQGIGRRKASIARVRIFVSKEKLNPNEDISINTKPFANYFGVPELREIVPKPLESTGLRGNIRVEAKVSGGGVRGQAEAVRLGIARALLGYDEGQRKILRDLGYLTRDARKVERKKAGLKKARRAPQWKKR